MAGTPLPPAPPGWNKTLDDLSADMRAGLIKSIGWPESEWARLHELSLLPAGMRFPRKGDVYEPLEPLRMEIMTSWAAPWTGGGSVTLSPGQRIRIDSDRAGEPSLLVYAVAVDYKAVEKLALAWWTRWRPAYRGFCFPVKTQVLATKFRLVAED